MSLNGKSFHVRNDNPWTDECDPYVNETSEHNVQSPIPFNNEEAKNHAKWDDRHGAHELTIETMTVNLCLLEKKVRRRAINEAISTIRHENFSTEVFVNKVRHYGHCREICRKHSSEKSREYMFKKKQSRKAIVSIKARYMTRVSSMSWKINYNTLTNQTFRYIQGQWIRKKGRPAVTTRSKQNLQEKPKKVCEPESKVVTMKVLCGCRKTLVPENLS